MSGAVRRALWCRWFHRQRMRRGSGVPVVAAANDYARIMMTPGPAGTICQACEESPFGSRAARRWGEQP